MGENSDLCSAFLDCVSTNENFEKLQQLINSALTFDPLGKLSIEVYYPYSNSISETIRCCNDILLPIAGGCSELPLRDGSWIDEDTNMLHKDKIKVVKYDVKFSRVTRFAEKLGHCITTIQVQEKQECVYVSIDGSSRAINRLLTAGEKFGTLGNVSSETLHIDESLPLVVFRDVEIGGLKLGEVAIRDKDGVDSFVGLMFQLSREVIS